LPLCKNIDKNIYILLNNCYYGVTKCYLDTDKMKEKLVPRRLYVEGLGEIVRIEERGNLAELADTLDKEKRTPANLQELLYSIITTQNNSSPLLVYSQFGLFDNLSSDAIVAVPGFPRVITCNVMGNNALRKEYEFYSKNTHPSSLNIEEFYERFLKLALEERSKPHDQKHYLILDSTTLNQCSQPTDSGFYIPVNEFQINPVARVLFKENSYKVQKFLEAMGVRTIPVTLPTTENHFYDGVKKESGTNERSFISPIQLRFQKDKDNKDEIQVCLDDVNFDYNGYKIVGKLQK
jgi:hypothetical protein